MISESIKDAGGMMTSATIARHSQMVGVGKALKKLYEKNVSGMFVATQRSEVTDRDTDLKKFVDILSDQDLFAIHSGRKHSSFPNIMHKIHSSIDATSLRERLQRLKNKIALQRQTVLSHQGKT